MVVGVTRNPLWWPRWGSKLDRILVICKIGRLFVKQLPQLLYLPAALPKIAQMLACKFRTAREHVRTQEVFVEIEQQDLTILIAGPTLPLPQHMHSPEAASHRPGQTLQAGYCSRTLSPAFVARQPDVFAKRLRAQ